MLYINDIKIWKYKLLIGAKVKRSTQNKAKSANDPKIYLVFTLGLVGTI